VLLLMLPTLLFLLETPHRNNMFVLPTVGLGAIATILDSSFTIEDTDTESNILSTTPTNPTGEVTIKLGTDTYDLYIYDGSAWYIFNNDS